MEGSRKLEYIITGICIGILILFMLSIGVRFFTRQIIVERMGIENAFTQIVFWDVENMAIADLEETTIDWKTLYPFEKGRQDEEMVEEKACPFVDKYVAFVKMIKGKVESYCTDLLAGHTILTQWNSQYNILMGHMGDDADILYMKNGYLTYVVPKISQKEIEKIGDSVLEFSNYLGERGIPFYYINAGSKVNPEDKELENIDIEREFSNENGDDLLKAFSDRNINTLDMREYMLLEDWDWYEAYYKSDHHWKTETALWAAGVIAQELNDREEFAFDLRLFDEDSYTMTTYENCFLGEQGRSVTDAFKYIDAYTCILPCFETDFTVEIPGGGLNITGPYKDTLYDYENLENVLQYSRKDYFIKPDAYRSVTWKNDPVGIFKNNASKDNADKKILILQDSFSWYSTTYLACDVGEIHIIHPENFEGSIRAYAKELKPDLVIMMCCEWNINPINWDVHTSMFDLR